MNEQQWDRIGRVAALMDEMDLARVEAVDSNGCLVIGQFIQSLLKRLPAEFLCPILGDPFDIFDRGAILPTSIKQVRNP